MSTPDAFSCGACSWFQATLIHNTTGLAATGYCRRHAPAHNGFPAVFVDGWCGDFTPGSEGTGDADAMENICGKDWSAQVEHPDRTEAIADSAAEQKQVEVAWKIPFEDVPEASERTEGTAEPLRLVAWENGFEFQFKPLEDVPEASERTEGAVEAASDAATETTEPDPQARINELLGETQWLRRGLDMATKRCDELSENHRYGELMSHRCVLLTRQVIELTKAKGQHLARIAQLEHETRMMRDALEESGREERSDSQSGRIAQLEDGLREMAKLAIDQIGARIPKSSGSIFTGSTEERNKAYEVICEKMEMAIWWLDIKNILKRCDVTLSTQEPTQEPQP
jgi:hypothetical protein